MRNARLLALFLAATLSSLASPGLEKLSPDQRTSLEQQIEKEISLARSGNVTAFATSFITRRTPAQRTAAGLDQLSPSELASIDQHVSRALANRPTYSYTHTKVTPNSIETETAKAKISGSVSMTYGTDGHGNNFYGGEVTTVWESPSRQVAIAITLARYKGDGVLLHSGRGYNSCWDSLALTGLHCIER